MIAFSLFTLSLWLFPTVLIAQDTGSKPGKVQSAALSEEMQIKLEGFRLSLQAQLQSEGEDLAGNFLQKAEAEILAAYVYENEDIGLYPDQVAAVAEFYRQISEEEMLWFQKLQGTVNAVKIIQVEPRQGANERMQLLIVALNIYFKEGALQSRRVSIVEVGGVFKILNAKL